MSPIHSNAFHHLHENALFFSASPRSSHADAYHGISRGRRCFAGTCLRLIVGHQYAIDPAA